MTATISQLTTEDVENSLLSASAEQLAIFASAWRSESDSLSYSVGIQAWQEAKQLLKGIIPIADSVGLREAVALTVHVIDARDCYSSCRCDELLSPFRAVFGS
jgi:hypothetical protein